MFSFQNTAIPGSKVGVAGDWHGDSAWADFALEQLSQAGISIVLHLGDFGLWPGTFGEKYFDWVEKVLENFSMELLVTPGNHEDYDQLEKMPLDDSKSFRTDPGHERIHFLERGARWTWAGREFLSLGGGASIDRKRRVAGESWWPQEQITQEDVARALSGGQVDVMVAHDSPEGVRLLDSHREGQLPLDAQVYANESRGRVREVTDAVTPKLYFHGHYHVWSNQEVTLQKKGKYEFYEMHSLCLDRERTPGNFGILNVDSLEFNLL